MPSARRSIQTLAFAAAIQCRALSASLQKTTFTRVGAALAQARAVRPSAAGEPPRRVGSWFPSTEPSVIAKVTLGPASSLSSAQAKSAGCWHGMGRLVAPQLPRRHVGSSALAVRLVSPVVSLAWLRIGILAAGSPPSNTCRSHPCLPPAFFSSATRLTIHSSGRAFGTPLNSNVRPREPQCLP